MKKINIHYKKSLLILGVAAGVLVLCVQIFVDVCVFRSVIYGGSGDHGTVIATLITDAVRNLNRPAPVDPMTGAVYIPEAHLVLPSYAGLGQIEYQYNTPQESGYNTPEIHLTSSTLLNEAESKVWASVATANNRLAWQKFDLTQEFASVPNLQACARGVQVFYGPQKSLTSGFTFYGARPLKDGRTLYVYSENGCKEDQSSVINMVKQAQSY